MKLTVYTPLGKLLQSDTESVSLPGELGRFMVLKNHAPLISHLVEGEIVFSHEGEKNIIPITDGFVRISDNIIEACVNLKK